MQKLRPLAVLFLESILLIAGYMGSRVNSYSNEFIFDEDRVSLLVEGIVCNHLAKVKESPIIRPADRFLWLYYDARKELD